MATPRRRSARLNKSNQPPQQQPLQELENSPRKAPHAPKLASLVERDETPEVPEPQSIDKVVATPMAAATSPSKIARLSALKTPKTLPSVDRAEMHPELAHQSTAKAPDEGLKFGFVDMPDPSRVSLTRGTPSKTARASLPRNLAAFDFNFATESQLSNEAQRLMDTVREEAARIKAQMKVERDAQRRKDEEAEQSIGGVNAAGRKIAQPKGKAGRFSDVHMAQFKKMDSIANHPSAFRARPGFAQQTTAQSLKRTGSKAELDEPDRPRTAGKGTPGRPPPPFLGRPTSVSPFKTIPQQPAKPAMGPAKRARHSELQDVSASKPAEQTQSVTTPARPQSNVRSSLFSPTKASLARTASQIPLASPNKISSIRRPGSVKSLRTAAAAQPTRPATSHGAATFSQSLSRLAGSESSSLNRPLPAIPAETSQDKVAAGRLHRSKSTTQLASPTKDQGQGTASKLPTFSGLKSILRTGRRPEDSGTDTRPSTPKRPNTAGGAPVSSKKVDFTPSVKSRYAVKLAAASPSPAKLNYKPPTPYALFDSRPYLLPDRDSEDDDGIWEDANDNCTDKVEYPVLPPIAATTPPRPSDSDTFTSKAKDLNRRESREFKSIFTTLHPNLSQPSTLTSVNMTINATNPTTHANKILRSPSNHSGRPSPNTIRRVRTSTISEPVQPFADANVATVAHGLSAKKRRWESAVEDDRAMADDDAKENRRISTMPNVPGGWNDSDGENADDEGAKRAGKRVKVLEASAAAAGQSDVTGKGAGDGAKKVSKAREEAKKNADARKGKGKGILSLSRLMALSRPKQRP